MTEKITARIIACDIFKPELDAVLERAGYEVDVTYISALLHSDPGDIAKAVTRALGEREGGRSLLLYGAKCHPHWDEVLAGRDVVRFEESNCIHLISGRAAKVGASRDLYLTAGWLARWRGFRKDDDAKDLGPETRRSMFARYCDRALYYDTGVREPDEAELAYFTQTTGLRVDAEPVGLDVFMGKLLDKLRLTTIR